MGNKILAERLPDKSSIYTAELNAVDLAFNYIEGSEHQNYVIFSDSMSCLQAIASNDWKHPTVQMVMQRYHYISNIAQKNVKFCWVPSHVGIKGNEKADEAAKEALDRERIANDVLIPHMDYKFYIKDLFKKKWQEEWDAATSNKLHALHPTVGLWPYGSRKSRREEVVLARLRIGHTYYTHSYLLKGEPEPECIPCGCPLTVKHILIECDDFKDTRRKYFFQEDLKDLFDQNYPNTIIEYLKEIGLYNKM